jgi:hypothetical protein
MFGRRGAVKLFLSDIERRSYFGTDDVQQRVAQVECLIGLEIWA